MKRYSYSIQFATLFAEAWKASMTIPYHCRLQGQGSGISPLDRNSSWKKRSTLTSPLQNYISTAAVSLNIVNCDIIDDNPLVEESGLAHIFTKFCTRTKLKAAINSTTFCRLWNVIQNCISFLLTPCICFLYYIIEFT